MKGALFFKTDNGLALLLFLGALLLYGNTIPNHYNLDDELVTLNHRLTSKGISGIPEIFQSNYYEDEYGYSYGYRPITLSSFALEHSLFGESPHVSHAVNVLLYALSCGLLFFLLRRLLPDQSMYLPLLAVVIFAVHPIHTEVVASIKNRDEILSLFFGILSLLFALWANHSEHKLKKPLFWIFALGLFLFGCWSKKSIVFLSFATPLLVILYGNKNKQVFPVIFSLLASLFVAFLLKLSTTQSIFYIAATTAIVHLAQAVKNESVADKLNSIRRILDKNWSVPILLSFASLFMILALLYPHLILFILGISLFILSSYSSNFSLPKSRIFIALNILGLFLYISYVMHDGVLSIVGIAIALLVMNSDKTKKWWRYLPVLIATEAVLLCIYGLDNYGILLFALVIFAGFAFFRPLMLVAPIVVIVTNLNDPILILAGTLMLGSVLIGLKYIRQKLPQAPNIISGIHIRLMFSVFLIFMIYGLYNQGLIPMEVISEANVEVKEDRPILAVENPLINNWDASNRISASMTSGKFFLQKILFPYPLRYYYGYNQIELLEPKSPLFYTTLGFILLLSILLIYLLLKHFKIGLFISLGLLFIIPYSNLFVPVAGIVGERLVYVASVWFCLALALILFSVNQKFPKSKTIIIGLTGVLIGASMLLVLHRNSLWKDKVTLFENDIVYTQNSAQAHALLAYAYMENEPQFKTDQEFIVYSNKIIDQFDQAITIYPNFLNWWYDKGQMEMSIVKIDDAQISFENAIAIDPNFSSEVYIDLAAINNEKEAYEDAIANLNKAQSLGYNQPDLFNTKAVSFLRMGNYEKAELSLLDGLIQYPNNYDLFLNLGKLYMQVNENKLALEYLQKAKNIDSTDPQLKAAINALQESTK